MERWPELCRRAQGIEDWLIVKMDLCGVLDAKRISGTIVCWSVA
jgi:hypothetical protein